MIHKKIFAGLLVALFALSNTPIKYLHFLFARHTDYIATTISANDSPQFSVAGIDCHCNSTVVIAPYTFDTEISSQKTLILFADHIIPKSSDIIFAQLFFFKLRGPPVVA